MCVSKAGTRDEGLWPELSGATAGNLTRRGTPEEDEREPEDETGLGAGFGG